MFFGGDINQVLTCKKKQGFGGNSYSKNDKNNKRFLWLEKKSYLCKF